MDKLDIHGPAVYGFVGPARSGKTGETIKELERQKHAKKSVIAVVYDIDNRFKETEMVGRDGLRLHAYGAICALDIAYIILSIDPNVEVCGIDRIHLFDDLTPDFLEQLANQDRIMIYNGSNVNFIRKPFPFRDHTDLNLERSSDITMGYLIARSDEVRYLKAVCTHEDEDGERCGGPATLTQRIIDGEIAPRDSPIIYLEDEDVHQPRCREHYILPD